MAVHSCNPRIAGAGRSQVWCHSEPTELFSKNIFPVPQKERVIGDNSNNSGCQKLGLDQGLFYSWLESPGSGLLFCCVFPPLVLSTALLCCSARSCSDSQKAHRAGACLSLWLIGWTVSSTTYSKWFCPAKNQNFSTTEKDKKRYWGR